MYKHWWYSLHNGAAIECDKCGKYVNRFHHASFYVEELEEDCPISDEKHLSEYDYN